MTPALLSTGLAVRWLTITGGPIRLAPTVAGKRLYVGSDDGYVFYLEVDDGSTVWKIRTREQLMSNLLTSGLTLLAIGAAPLAAADDSRQADFFVATGGSDANPGTLESPFATLKKARDAVRAKIQRGLRRDVLVLVRGGRYELATTLVFDSRDSGTAEHGVTYAAFPGEWPVISGGRVITGWRLHRDGIWKASTSLEFRQLYVNGKRAVRARTPNLPDYYRLKAWDESSKTIHIDASQIQKWSNLKRVEIIAQLFWSESIMRLDGFTTTGDTAALVPQNPERDLVFERLYPPRKGGQTFHFENAYEMLDTEEEWYLDTNTDTLYYKPLVGVDMARAEVIAPAVETLLKIEGTLDDLAGHLTFRGLTLEHSNWLVPGRQGHLNMQAGMYNRKIEPNNKQYCFRPPAAVYVAAAEHVKFERNVFRNIGACALDLHFGTDQTEIVGNVFREVSGNGIQLAWFADENTDSAVPYLPKDARHICRNDVIRDNYIAGVGRDYYGCVAVACGYPQQVTIEHNEITDTPYSGISIGWGWHEVVTPMKGNKIRYNELHHVMTMLCDGAAIYTLSAQPDSEIAYNYIHDIKASPWALQYPMAAVYLDQGSDFFTVHHNVCERLQQGRVKTLNQNHTGMHNVFHDHPVKDDTIKRQAGLEPRFEDIRNR